MLDIVIFFYYFGPLWSVEDRVKNRRYTEWSRRELCPQFKLNERFFIYQLRIIRCYIELHKLLNWFSFRNIFTLTINLVFHFERIWSYYAEKYKHTVIRLLQFVPCSGTCNIVNIQQAGRLTGLAPLTTIF